ncbi:hypothetical protein FB45DRAFT_976103 [Roridomyces roridus]|uniref:NAD(P)-binding protein n=1 Tax=Roridomyces roridus TaxID=1738132 RepID=A0AAD7C6Q5_9AGAR|nr:hypothetical protein FB45DRAFT_976103 [Roridomyces roridus]
MSTSKIILVTGSNTGIGYSLVELLAARGHTVYLASRGEAAGLESVAKLKQEKNLDVKFVQLDVTDDTSIKAAVSTIEKAEGKLDVLVNNAGAASMNKPHSASKPNFEALEITLATNLFGLIRTTTAFLPLIRAAHSASSPSVILNVTSDMASNGLMAQIPKNFLHDFVAYNTSKAAANSYTVGLAKDLEAEGIRVNTATPGFTTTKLNGFAEGGKTSEQAAAILLPWALLDKDGPTGRFAKEGGESEW